MQLKFSSNELRDEAYGIVQAIWSNYTGEGSTSSESSAPDTSSLDVSDDLSIQDSIPEDAVQERHWEIILMGTCLSLQRELCVASNGLQVGERSSS